MSDIQQYFSGSISLPRDSRQAGRSISRYRADGAVSITAVDTVTDVAIAKIDSITACTGHAMGAVTRVAQVQKHLELLAPEAAGRMALLADGHALTMVELLADHHRAVRRF